MTKLAVLFDLDGTLLDTAPDLGAALNCVLQDYGLRALPLSDTRPYASHGSTGLLKFGFGEQFSLASPMQQQRWRQQFLDYYEARICEQTQLFAGVSELLANLHARHLAIGIVTNKPTRYTDLVLQSFPELAKLGSVVCGDTLAVNKPDPAPLHLAAEQLQVPSSQCIYVGDAERDIIAGRNAGMETVLARYGYIRCEEQPENWQADYDIHAPLELLKILA
ncbi:HAD family hydrolase [Aliidiomarina haloalkalitolerans]|uniref:Phosphoglycolate phosphatase n=1 Tax=Aliidiomarina haloalkalitolerans TaxID=859059 RepID=A0A432VYI4_9GAMM|nr:HAD-IA family hydrolase [Aliidiomarina haloalkalitolerans]MCL4409611.1 HAD-IA family hydrolase [Gammaproteobacteria bacterium]RUO21731.1 phosphoglycolate phosphatase [Aliidiomarina haloalkalitolerans]